MREEAGAFILALVLVSASTSACAMKAPAEGASRCTVEGGEKLPASSGGAAALCKAIERAMSSATAGKDYRVEVRVVRTDTISATVVTGDGRRLPALSTSISDATFTPQMLDRFASELAGHVASQLHN